jgi:hypothetical protein
VAAGAQIRRVRQGLGLRQDDVALWLPTEAD